MKQTLQYSLVFLLLMAGFTVQAQKSGTDFKQQSTFGQAGIHRSVQAGLEFPDFPLLTLTSASRAIDLPWVVDNSTQPYLRPVFSQQGASCGQAALVGYNFCYEINRMRQLSADTSIHLYPDHFVWNFMNYSVPYYGGGVSYFHSFDLLFDAGTPTEAVYGPIELDDSYYWMSGYEGYYQAMQNRISGASSIHVGTAQGIEVLKHWLHNHLEEAAVGGVANFYSGLKYGARILPEGTEEAGKRVFTEFGEEATHAMTIVGYNDSIKYDLNNDGRFTNELDINGDGLVDVKDWEKGGVKFVNSYGPNWADSGFAYILYSALAQKYGEGGIWNNAVHVLHPDTMAAPKLTIKASIAYNKRMRIRLRAGIATDTAHYFPEKSMAFSLFNFQGGDFPMGGNPGSDTLELGLDISSLMSYVAPDTPFRVFLLIDEEDPDSTGNGSLLDFSVLEYEQQTLVQQADAEDLPLAVMDNSTTVASLVFQHNQPNISIQPADSVFIHAQADSSIQFTASGGMPPYSWQLNTIFHEANAFADYPTPQGNMLVPDDHSMGYAAVALPFSFPFGSKTYDSVYVHVNGYLMFDRQDMPYYYLTYDELYLRQIKAIAAYMNHKLGLNSADDYMIYESDTNSIVFHWRISDAESNSGAIFSVRLFSDGKMEYHYGNIASGMTFLPVIGLSDGSRESTVYSVYNKNIPTEGQRIVFIPDLSLDGLEMAEDGLLKLAEPETIKGSVQLSVTDAQRMTATKNMTFSKGLSIELQLEDPYKYLISGETVPLTIYIQNHSENAFMLNDLGVTSLDQRLTLAGQNLFDIELLPGESIAVADHFTAFVEEQADGKAAVLIEVSALADGERISAYTSFPIGIVHVELSPPVIVDNQNGRLDPGEAAVLVFRISNSGLASAGELHIEAVLDDPYASISTADSLAIAELKGLTMQQISFGIQVNSAAPKGRSISFKISISDQDELVLEKTVNIGIGRTPILLVDKDKNHNSAVHLGATMQEMDIQYDLSETIGPNILQYDQVFLSLGFLPNNHSLRTFEDTILIDYLRAGGNLYLEGGSFFKFDQPTMLRDYLRVQGSFNAVEADTPADTITGIQGSLMEDMKFYYRGDQVLGENLIALEPAVPLFRDDNTGYDFMVALDSGDYKAIATSLEFGGLIQTGPHSRHELVRRYLSYFGYQQFPLAAKFAASERKICAGESVAYSFEGMGIPTLYSWSFEGGMPETSNAQQPVIQYDIPGSYAVSLSVEDGAESNTFSLESFVQVVSCTGVDEQPDVDFSVSPNPAHSFIWLKRTSRQTERATLRIFDLSGRLVSESIFPQGQRVMQLGIDKLQPGYYLISLSGETEQKTTKLLVY
ncbi:MAG: T9SS type A sorting domain-containing protein [Bacteroidetes bacterium]|nr:T9SS type A sorting domain-containing protein [Bacteroidota bacterium]